MTCLKHYVNKMDAATLNVGLNIAMEWGEDWLQPIQERLRAQFPKLDVATLDECNEICQAAMRTGYELASECMIGIGLWPRNFFSVKVADDNY